ncbi:MAG: exodeoxyribonuclease VII large subunit [Planctomycetota bacterium]|nr:exodeoxyribonuclease VII large subunit [Planctomycetota bacterium]
MNSGLRQIVSVTELTAQIRSELRASFPSVWVAGEISDISQPASGHIYLTLKDGQSQLRAVIWQSVARRLPGRLQDGVLAVCGGELDVYPRHGSYQLVVKTIELQGEGALQWALKQLQQRLAAEGLFEPERKRPIPKFPRLVAVVTSPTSAAVRDFLEVAKRRSQGTRMLVIPASVQGDQAVPDLLRGLDAAHRLLPRPDVVVLTRGGGSLEDLWAYNDERLIRAISAASIPVVAAVGHEIDVTLCDLVADVRALTPSEAAERVVPDQAMWLQQAQRLEQAMHHAVLNRVQQARQRWRFCAEHPRLTRPLDRIRDESRRIDDLWHSASLALRHTNQRHQQRFAAVAAQLHVLSPLAVLGRGFAVINHATSKEVIMDIDQLQIGDYVEAQVHRGRFQARVEQRIQPSEPGDSV